MSKLPLDGMRIVELTQIYAGPYASTLLADWGAELIRLESIQGIVGTTRGIYSKVPKELIEQTKLSGTAGGAIFPNWDPGDRPWNRAVSMTSTGRNKLSMTLDLLRPEGLEILGKLFAKTDVFIENNVPETIEKLQISYEWLKEINPAIIMIRMPAFGLNGPYKNYRCLGLHVDGVSGHSYNKGYVDEEPSRRGETVAADAAAGASAAFAAFTALWNRRKTGKGQLIELPLAENFIPFMSDSIMDFNINKRIRSTIGNRHRRMAPHGVYPCTGIDKWMTIAVGNDDQWRALCEIIEDKGLIKDSRFKDARSRLKNQDELDDIVSGWTMTQDHLQAFHKLQEAGIPSGPVLNELEALKDPHLVDRSYYETLENSELPKLQYPGPLWRMSKTPNHHKSAPPLLGEHNEYIYKTILEFSDAEYERLEDDGHIGMDIIEK